MKNTLDSRRRRGPNPPTTMDLEIASFNLENLFGRDLDLDAPSAPDEKKFPFCPS